MPIRHKAWFVSGFCYPPRWGPKTLKVLLLQKGCLTYHHQGLAKLVETFVNWHQPSMCSDLTCWFSQKITWHSRAERTQDWWVNLHMVQQDDTYDHHRRTHPPSIHGSFVNQHNGAPATINPTSTLDVAMNPVTLLYQLVGFHEWWGRIDIGTGPTRGSSQFWFPKCLLMVSANYR